MYCIIKFIWINSRLCKLIYRDRKRISGYLNMGWGMQGEKDWGITKNIRKFWVDGYAYYMSMGMFSGIYTYIKYIKLYALKVDDYIFIGSL